MKKLLVLAALMATGGVARADLLNCSEIIDTKAWARWNERVSCGGTCFHDNKLVVTTGSESHAVKIWDWPVTGTNEGDRGMRFCGNSESPADGGQRQMQLDCWGVSEDFRAAHIQKEAYIVIKQGQPVIVDQRDIEHYSANGMLLAGVAITTDGTATFATVHGVGGKTITWTCSFRVGDHQLQ